MIEALGPIIGSALGSYVFTKIYDKLIDDATKLNIHSLKDFEEFILRAIKEKDFRMEHLWFFNKVENETREHPEIFEDYMRRHIRVMHQQLRDIEQKEKSLMARLKRVEQWQKEFEDLPIFHTIIGMMEHLIRVSNEKISEDQINTILTSAMENFYIQIKEMNVSEQNVRAAQVTQMYVETAYFGSGQYPQKKQEKKSPLLFIPHPYPEAPNFTGRKKERAMLTKWLLEDREHPLLSMVAIGGMGKSALAWRWVMGDVIGKDVVVDGIVWWSFYERGMTFDSFVRSFAAKRWGKESPMLGWPMSDLYNAIYQEFQQNRYLIVLDGVERILKAYFGLGCPYQKDDDKTLKEEKDYRVCIDPNAGIFLQWLANKITKSRTVLTTRLHPKVLDFDKVSGCIRFDLVSMEPKNAVAFFHFQGVKGTRAEIEQECEKYGYHPLSLRLLTGLIVSEPGCSGDIKDCIMIERIKDMAPRKHNILELAYESIDDSTKDFTCKLAAFRGEMDYEAVKSISSIKKEKELKATIKEVVNRGILYHRKERGKNNHELSLYDFHPIVRHYFYKRLKKPKFIHEKIAQYYSELYMRVNENKNHPYLSDIALLKLEKFIAIVNTIRMETEEGNYIPESWKKVITIISDDKPKGRIRNPLLNDLRYGIQQRLPGLESIIEINSDEELPNKLLNSNVLRFLTSNLNTNHNLNDLIMRIENLTEQYPPETKSYEELQIVIELFHHIILSERYDDAFKLWLIRIWEFLYFQFGYYQIQIELLTAFFINGELKLSDYTKKGMIYNELANSHSLSGQPCKAIPFLNKSISIAEYLNDKSNLTIGLINLAIKYRILGDLRSTKNKLLRSIEIAKKINNERNEHIARQELGRTLLFLGLFKQSRKQLIKSQNWDESNQDIQGQIIDCTYHSIYYLLINRPQNALEYAKKGHIHVKKFKMTYLSIPRDLIRILWTLGASYVNFLLQSNTNNQVKYIIDAESHLNKAITECRKINLIELEAPILLELAKLRHLQKKEDESLSLATEALEIVNRCSYVLQQADIHLFLGKYYRDTGDLDKAMEHARLAKLRSYQMIDVETGDYVTKAENTKYKYKPCYDKAVKLLESLGS